MVSRVPLARAGQERAARGQGKTSGTNRVRVMLSVADSVIVLLSANKIELVPSVVLSFTVRVLPSTPARLSCCWR